MKEARLLCPVCGRVDKVAQFNQRTLWKAWADPSKGVYEHTIESGGYADIQHTILSLMQTEEGKKIVAELERRAKAFLNR